MSTTGEQGNGNGLLFDVHLRELRASAISDEVIAERGYETIGRPSNADDRPRQKLKRLGIPSWAWDEDSEFPGLLIPLHGARGEVVSWQYKPRVPVPDPVTGKPRKYASPRGRASVIDVHPRNRDKIIDPTVELWITEGTKKADSLTSRGVCAIALHGVYGWREQLGTLGDWEDIRIKGRKVVICFDSDILANKAVRSAAQRLAAWLRSKGAASVSFIWPREIDGEQPKGIDDYFAAGGDLQHLTDGMSAELPALAAGPRPPQVPEYREQHGCIIWAKPGRDGPAHVQLANFTARITGHVVVDDGSGELRRQFEITACRAGREYVFSVPADRFPSMGWAIDQLGPEAIVAPGLGLRDNARTAVQMLSGEVPGRHVYAHTGWRQLPGGAGYLTASGAMMKDGLDTSVTVELDGPLSRYDLPDPADPAAVRDAVLASLAVLELAPDPVTVLLLAAVYRAPLPLLPDCTAWLRGPSGALKTALCALAQQHFGAEMDARHLPGSWESTANRLEVDAHAVANAVFTVDDYRPALNTPEARWRAQAVERLIRGSANQSPRGRLRSDVSRRPDRPPRAQVLSSAEDIPPGVASMRARTMIGQIAAGAVDLAKLSAAQQAAGDGVLALAMAGYVRWLAARYARLQETLKPRVAELRAGAVADGHPRTAENIASLFLGWEQWLFYAVDIGAAGRSPAGDLGDRTWKVLGELGAEQARYLRDSDHVSGFLRALNAIISSGRGHLAAATMAGGEPGEPQRWGWQFRSRTTDGTMIEGHGFGIWEAQGRRLGWASDGDVYLDPEVTFQAARQWAEQVGAPVGVSKDQLLDDLKERNLLASTDAGRSTTRRDLSGRRSKRVLHLTAWQFENYGQ